jgi:hypothetical protein
MHLSIRVLGLELLSIEASTDDEAVEGEELAGGDLGSTVVGFARDVAGVEWQAGVER